MKIYHLLFILLLLPVKSQAQKSVMPVLVGGDSEYDACAGLSVVQGLQNTLLAVRAGPGTQYPKLDDLQNGQTFYNCTISQDEQWLGIVYSDTGKAQVSCGVSSPIGKKQPYKGACRAGWVHKKWTKLIAG